MQLNTTKYISEVKMSDRKIKISTSIRLEADLYEKVKKEAERRKRSMAYVIEEKIRKSYKEKT